MFTSTANARFFIKEKLCNNWLTIYEKALFIYTFTFVLKTIQKNTIINKTFLKYLKT